MDGNDELQIGEDYDLVGNKISSKQSTKRSKQNLGTEQVDSIGRMPRFEHFCATKMLVLSSENSNKISVSLSDNVRTNGYLVIRKIF